MKNITLLFALLLASAVSFAQWKQSPQFGNIRQHNVTISARGGIASLLINGSRKSPTKLGLGGGAEVGYTYQLTPVAGLHTGIGASFTSSGFLGNNMRSSYSDDVSTYTDDVRFNGRGRIDALTGEVSETYSTLTVDIPLQLSLQYGSYYGALGFRLMVPLSIGATYSYSRSTRGIGYFYETGVDFSDDPVSLGSKYEVPAESGDYDAYSLFGDDDFAYFVNIAAELCYRTPLNNGAVFMVGLYADYSLNSVAVQHNRSFLEFSGDGYMDYAFNGAMQSNLVQSYRYISLGLKLTYAMSYGRRVK